MELVEVEIIGQVITARYGTLSTGDILRTDQAFADHLVNDCKGAKWPEPKEAAKTPPDQPIVEALSVDVAQVPMEKPAAKPVKKAAK